MSSSRGPPQRGPPQFVSSVVGEEDSMTSVKIEESRGWRVMFPELPDNGGGSGFCGKFKFAIWAVIAVALVAAAIGLSIAMVVINENKGGRPPGPYIPPGTLSPTPNPNNKSPTPSPNPHTDEDGQLEILENPPFDVPSGWTALWWDEFEGNTIDSRYWSYDIGYGKDYGLWAWGNQEQQYYNPNNVEVSDGTLKLIAKREKTVLDTGYTFNYTSGRITSKGKLGIFGGMKTSDGRQWNTIRIEASIKAPQPSPVGLWVAYWFLPIDMRYGVWASSGEMDLYEMKNTFEQCNFALHYGGPWPKANKRYNFYNPRATGGTFSSDFTAVTLDWSTDQIQMLMQGNVQLSKKSKAADPSTGYYSEAYNAGPGAPFDIPFYMILNFSVGGRYPGNATDATVLPNTLEVDYIRVFGKN